MADEGTGEGGEGKVEVRTALVSDGEAAESGEFGKTDQEIADVLGQRTIDATPIYHRTADMRRSNAPCGPA